MRLHILSLMGAIDHIPTHSTYTIRIFSSYDDKSTRHMFKLQESPLYRHVTEYEFDDIFSKDEKGILFTPDIADTILTHFARNRQECEDLLVHCGRGKNRSPAVAIALNEIFGLGQDTRKLKSQYEETNWHVYDLLKERAKELATPTR